ncbi:LysR family transcriptional regulator [Ruegeria sp. Ofav3-42]|uniref:LysR family transcriptional regulator n=1 Tax=Ruegeria sp. Ofav3-42 TaxID=2917759 RepID=UPI001EF72BEA|nr:LysR family transcriptional regulator [Ruegeria sp. Ofav3-42]MCG7522660.1 LysR family transcriptional regulator [Ruegeria sp. Ofav3-42]
MAEGPFLDLRHLKMIRAIARHGRVTDAAEALGITSSALSHRIREAERRLDLVLFTRMHKRLRMTPAAEYLAEMADRVLGEMERAELDVRRMDRGIAHVVRICVETYSSYHWLPGFNTYLRDHLPDTELQVTANVGRDPVHALMNRDVDLVIASGDTQPIGTCNLPLFSDELLFVVAPEHRLAGKPFVDGVDIEGEEFITYALTPEPDREFARLFRPSGRYPRWTTMVELPEAIVELVAAGQGSSVLAGWAVRPAIKTGRLVGARVGKSGIDVPWQALIRLDDQQVGPILEVAKALADWCAENGGFG